ncbi:MAG: hypothetical protein ACWA5K_09395 [bacterium]
MTNYRFKIFSTEPIAAALVIAACLLSVGCGTTPEVVAPTPEPVYTNPEDNPDYWYQRTEQENSDSGQFLIFKTSAVTENWPGESLRWSVRTVASDPNSTDDAAAKIAHQLYFHIRYKGDWRAYRKAELDSLVPRRINEIAKNTGSCDFGCILEEDFAITLSTDEIRRLAERDNTRIRLRGEKGEGGNEHETLLEIPGVYLQGHLKKLLERLSLELP